MPYMQYITKTSIIHDLRQNIYLASLHKSMEQSGMPEQAVFKIAKQVHFVSLSSFSFPGLTQDSLDCSP